MNSTHAIVNMNQTTLLENKCFVLRSSKKESPHYQIKPALHEYFGSTAKTGEDASRLSTAQGPTSILII